MSTLNRSLLVAPLFTLILCGCHTAPLQTTPGLSSSDLHQQKLNDVLANGGKKHWWTRGTKATPVAAYTDEKIPSSEKDLKNPDQLYLLHGKLHERTGNLGEAEVSYAKALKFNPKKVEAKVGMARVRIAQKRLDEAQDMLMEAHEKDPESSVVWHGIARLYQTREDNTRAIQAMRKAIQYDEVETQYRNELASLLVVEGEDQLAYQELRVVYSEPEAAYFVAALIYNNKGDLNDCGQYLNLALSKNSDFADAKRLLAAVDRDKQYATFASRRSQSNTAIRQVSHPQAGSR